MGQSYRVFEKAEIALNGDLAARTHDLRIARAWQKLSVGLFVANTNVTGLSWTASAAITGGRTRGFDDTKGTFYPVRSRNVSNGTATRYSLTEVVNGVAAGTDFSDLAEYDCLTWEWVRFVFIPTGTLDATDVLTAEFVAAGEID